MPDPYGEPGAADVISSGLLRRLRSPAQAPDLARRRWPGVREQHGAAQVRLHAVPVL